jgi:hypothetical protein
MGTHDDGISKDGLPDGGILIGIVVFLSVALYNVVELTFIIFATFKRRTGLYFWSFIIATWGIAPYSAGFLMKYLGMSDFNWGYVTLIVVGWCSMVTGQSVVLYSRLHIVVRNVRLLKSVLGMICFNAIVCHIPIIVLVYGANSAHHEPFIKPYSIYEKVQVTVFFLQEITLSGLYIYETVKLMRVQRTIRSSERVGNSKKLMTHLIVVNIIIVLLDITILALEYADLYVIQTAYKALVYSVKLKMEFSILNKLVEIITGTSAGGGSSGYARQAPTHKGEGVRMEAFDGEGPKRMTNNGVGYKTYVRSGQDNGAASPVGGNVLMTTEIVVKRDKLQHDIGLGGDSTDDIVKPGVVGDVESAMVGEVGGKKKGGASSSSSSEIQFAGLGY